MKITFPDKTNAAQPTGATTEMPAEHYNEIKDVVNTNDDIATPLSVAYSTTVKADRIRFKAKHTMAVAVALTLDDTGAIAGLGETIPFVGDGNNITISGGTIVPSQNATIATTAGVELLLVLVWSGSYWQVGIEGANSTTPSYVFANTHEMVIDASGEGVIVSNNDLYPSDGAGNDADVSFELWFKTPATLSSDTLYLARDTNGGAALWTIGVSSLGAVALQFLSDGSNILKKKTGDGILFASTLYHIVVTKTGETYAGVKIYIDGVESSYGIDESTGIYIGFPILVGSLQIDIGNSIGADSGKGNYQILRQYNIALAATGQVDYLYNLGVPRGIAPGDVPTLNTACKQENLFNNTPNADNIGVDGTNQGTVTYITI